jgi:hypothetical protein
MVKYIPLAAQVLILVALLIAAGAMMTGYMTMPQDAGTRSALTALAGIFITILDPKSLQARKEVNDEKKPDDSGGPPATV